MVRVAEDELIALVRDGGDEREARVVSYLIRRVALALVVLFGLLVATFFIIHLVPGDPVRIVLGGHATPAAIDQVRHQLDLDRPLLTQFWLYVSHTVRGHFGEAFTLNSPVGQVIAQRIGPSAALIIYAMVLALLIGIPLAILAALRPNGILDNALRLGTTFTFAMPAFWLGLMLALIFGLSSSGSRSPATRVGSAGSCGP